MTIALLILFGISIVAIIISLIIYLINRKKWRDVYYSIGKEVCLAFLISSIISGVLFGCVGFPLAAKVYTKETHIYSLSNGSEVNGKFYLGNGFIAEKQYYYFYVKKDKGYILNKAAASCTYIIEVNGRTPSFVREKEKWADEYQYLVVPVDTIIFNYNVKW